MLLETARAVLEDTTVAKLTMQDVARRARVHAALIHYYFRSKHGLVVALVDDFVARLEEDLSGRRSDAHVADALLSVIEAYAGLASRERYVSLVAIESLVRPEREVHPGSAVMDALATHVERALRRVTSQTAGGDGTSVSSEGTREPTDAADPRAITAHLVLDASLVCEDAALPDDARRSALARAVDRLLYGLFPRRTTGPAAASPA
jgi:AcrR family transcriptional regulator